MTKKVKNSVILNLFQDLTHPKTALILIFGLIALVSLTLNYLLTNKIADNLPGNYQVSEVFDGDSFSIPPDQSIRLAFLNAPELEFCYGQESKEGLESLIQGKNVKIEKITKDTYGRTIALVYQGDQLINQTILENGWGKYDSERTNEKLKPIIENLKAANQHAKENQVGIWSEQCYQKENKQNPECDIKGNMNTSSGDKIYHYPGCDQYKQAVVELNTGEQWFCTEEEARQAGFTKSQNCRQPYNQ
ncbi:MAG: thermonuclease family protein [Patescibacteria group bacterium]|jgi:micrococcal nuclease